MPLYRYEAPQPKAPPSRASAPPEPACTSTSIRLRVGWGGVGGRGGGLGGYPASLRGQQGPAGRKKPRAVAAGRYPAVLCDLQPPRDRWAVQASAMCMAIRAKSRPAEKAKLA